MRPSLSCVLPLSGALLLWPQPTGAQVRVELGPVVGVFAPTSNVSATAPGSVLPLPGDAAKHRTGFAYGAAATLWPTQHFGLGLLAMRSSSELEFSSIGSDTAITAAVSFGAALALWRLPYGPRTNDIRFGIGLGVLKHEGAAYRPYGEPTSTAATASFGTLLALDPHLGVDLGLTAFLYRLQLSSGGTSAPQSRFQTDLLGRVAVAYRIGHPAKGR
jgi:hypothetical protein